jgi:hypothetical protein
MTGSIGKIGEKLHRRDSGEAAVPLRLFSECSGVWRGRPRPRPLTLLVQGLVDPNRS